MTTRTRREATSCCQVLLLRLLLVCLLVATSRQEDGKFTLWKGTCTIVWFRKKLCGAFKRDCLKSTDSRSACQSALRLTTLANLSWVGTLLLVNVNCKGYYMLGEGARMTGPTTTDRRLAEVSYMYTFAMRNLNAYSTVSCRNAPRRRVKRIFSCLYVTFMTV